MEAAVLLQQEVEEQLEMIEGLPWLSFTFDKQKWNRHKLIEKNKKSLLIEIYVKKNCHKIHYLLMEYKNHQNFILHVEHILRFL